MRKLSNKRAKCEHTHDRPCVDVVKPEGGSCRSWSLLGHCSVTKSARSCRLPWDTNYNGKGGNYRAVTIARETSWKGFGKGF